MADWTAITGIVVSGVFGPATAALLAGLHLARGRQHERELLDLAELRTLLDEASVELREAEGIRSHVGTDVQTHGEHVVERSPDAVELLRLAGRTLTLHSERIAVRLGASHPVSVAHRKVTDLVVDAYGAVWNLDPMNPGEEVREVAHALRDSRLVRSGRQQFVEEGASARRLEGRSRTPAGKRRENHTPVERFLTGLSGSIHRQSPVPTRWLSDVVLLARTIPVTAVVSRLHKNYLQNSGFSCLAVSWRFVG